MNLLDTYGPTLTLKELLPLIKISRSTYYSHIKDKENTIKKEGKKWLPDPIQNFNKKLFYTCEVERYLQPNTS